ncbi:LAME_0A00892g1_1 [Lachancea meyersii CBS 8951]|uniref:LAME_0A00892g1_1 n=1 Tax=Lachancea meyersii CBS 8951 TaxID=1266667 RepID=A0A1G4ILB3_9SACH|nr:LAME_0A00892g1_1 [Lachancea meyersii CBS 8951]
MSSIFGSSSRPDNRFSNLMVNLPQQQMQQQQSTSAFTHQQPVHSQALVGPGSAGQGYEQNTESSKTSWFNNPRKRTIPQTIVKRAAKAEPSDTSNGNGNSATIPSNGSGFGAMTFGSKQPASSYNPNKKHHEPRDPVPNAILIDSNEAPPTKSLFDWQREDEFGSMLPAQQSDARLKSQSLSSSKSYDASALRNVFDRDAKADASKQLNGSPKIVNATDATKRGESAVIVFGYPESISNQIIIQFSKFGTILEDFEVLRSASGINAATLRLRNQNTRDSGNRRKYPIFTGDGWIKLTYDSPSSALRALQENGVVYGGCLIGCVPYNKSAVEQLASCTIENSDDIGSFSPPTNSIPNGGVGSIQMRNDSPGDFHGIHDNNASYLNTQRLDMKDGKALFVNNGSNTAYGKNFLQTIETKMQDQEDQTKKPTGVMGKVNNWLFGWNDL